MLMIDGGSLQNELMKYFDFSDDTPTKSAYCQQRAKILPDAIQFLFFTFTKKLEALDTLKLFHGHRMVRTWKASVLVQISVWEYGFECAVIHATRIFAASEHHKI